MKKIITTIQQYLGEFFTTIGVTIFFYNIFNFDYKTYGYGLDKIFRPESEFKDIAYYYSDNTLAMIAIGAAISIIGLLIIKNKK